MFPSRWLVLGALVLLSGCVRTPYHWAHELPEPLLTGEGARVRPGDTLFVFVRGQPEMSSQVVVAQDGTVALPIVGQIAVTNSSVEEVGPLITARLTGVLEKPQVRVSVVDRRKARIVVVGEVRDPGTFEVPDGTHVVDALAEAGGLTEFANRQRLFVLRRGDQSLRVRFRYADLARGEATSSRFVLLDGDVIVAE